MIKFIRKFRREMISEDKFFKYLLYAIGEILLVVIGILIALQVNNWNEQRVALNREQQILHSLHSEFSYNLDELKFDIARLDTSIHNLEILMDLMLLDQIPVSTNVDSLISLTLNNPTWNPSSYVLNDLKNSGSISRLSNTDLQTKLFAWERHFENVQEVVEFFTISTGEMVRFLREESTLRDIDTYADLGNIQPSRIGFDNKELLQNLRFENYVDDKLITAYQVRNEYLESITIIEDLLTAIRI